jgi:hypothetical protein
MKKMETKIYEKKIETADNVYHITTISASICEYDKNRIHIIEKREYNTNDGTHISSTINQIIINKETLIELMEMMKKRVRA